MDSQEKRIRLSAVLWSPGEVFSCCVLSGEGHEHLGHVQLMDKID